jgi:hypothetical protein
VELYPHSPNTSSWRGAQLKESTEFNFFEGTEMIAGGERQTSEVTRILLIPNQESGMMREIGLLGCPELSKCGKSVKHC